jgi:hypothetical protein
MGVLRARFPLFACPAMDLAAAMAAKGSATLLCCAIKWSFMFYAQFKHGLE